MKRALAERAKQQSDMSNGIGPTALVPDHGTNVSTPSDQPHRKVPKTMSSDSVSRMRSSVDAVEPESTPSLLLTSSSTQTPNKATSNHIKETTKRKRNSLVVSSPSVANLGSEDEDDTDRSAFYLRQQNRALGGELRQIKYQLQQLQRERDYRRHQCYQACQSINSLQATWTQMESALLSDANNGSSSSVEMGADASNMDGDAGGHGGASSNVPASTGTGSSVELVGALLTSISELGGTSQSERSKADGMDDDSSDSEWEHGTSKSALSKDLSSESKMQELDDMLRITDNISQRANLLQKWIWGVLQHATSPKPTNGQTSVVSETEVSKLSNQVSRLKAKYKRRRQQMQEIAKTRDAVEESDRRVRRGLYRLAAHRVPLKEVLKDIERTDADKELAARWMAEETARTAISMAMTSTTAVDGSQTNADGPSTDAPDTAKSLGSSMTDKQVSNLEEISKTRQDAIEKLLDEKKERELKLNEMSQEISKLQTEGLASGDKAKLVTESELYIEQSSSLESSKRQIDEMKETIQRLRNTCSMVMGNEALASKALEDMQEKHDKKWSELVSSYDDDVSAVNVNADADTDADGCTASRSGDNGISSETKPNEENQEEKPSTKRISAAERKSLELAAKVINLEHKLTQALENVRQAETTRQLLTEATMMNECLQTKIDELKAKYAALQQATKEGKVAGPNGGEKDASIPGDASSAPSTPKQKSASLAPSLSSSSALPPAEKLYKDNKKLQRDLEKYRAARESLKSKFERVEKEREAMFQTNAKLLKHTTEKDEMNAKSLSTILHLKQVTEKMIQEKESLEQQAKTANQVGLAARLAENARERVLEEFQKARQEMTHNVTAWEEKCSKIARERDSMHATLLKQQAVVSTRSKDLEASKLRCDELVSEVTAMEKEKHELAELLAVAQKEAAEAKSTAPPSSEGGNNNGSASIFTVDQLSTQVSVLKNRLACPVCNHRDKKCILLRCRHMFCKECVDTNIKNRSRKCPACGIRFDTKDVADVWL
mmetsp:Transcript_21383/g.61069  ORF Transcript_21383/g.61069 Transcript_21383/m.61069 type:complete len:1013 (-) Transcript_21383:485-3523(-)